MFHRFEGGSAPGSPRIHVLAPLDRSAYSAAAQALAIRIAGAQPSRLAALRVVNVRSASGRVLRDLPGWLGFEPAVVDAEVEAEAVREAQALVDGFVARAAAEGVAAEGLVEQGAIDERIAHHGAAADLVVMGFRGESEERFPGQGGGHAQGLLQRIATPVLWATPGADRIDAVAVGYDGSESARRAVRAVRHLLAPLGVPIHAIHVTPDGAGDAVLAELGTAIGAAPVVPRVVRGTAVHEALVDAAVEVGAQVLVLGFHGAARLTDALFGTVAERCLGAGRIAVLAVH